MNAIDFSIIYAKINSTQTGIKWEVIRMFVINDECLSCGTCVANCPAEAIKEGDSHYEIDQDVCVGCGTCAANCPADAIEEK